MKKNSILFILLGLLCLVGCNKDDDSIEKEKESPWVENDIIIDSYTLQVNRGNHQTQYVKKVTINVDEYGYMLSQGRGGEKFDFYEVVKEGDWEGEIRTTSPIQNYYIWDKQGNFVDSASITLPIALGEFTISSFEYNKETDVLTASWQEVEGADYYSLIISRDIGWIFYTSEGTQELYPRTTIKNYYNNQIEKGKNSLEINLGIDAAFCEKYQSDTFYLFLVAVNKSESEDLVKLGACQQIYKGKLDL